MNTYTPLTLIFTSAALITTFVFPTNSMTVGSLFTKKLNLTNFDTFAMSTSLQPPSATSVYLLTTAANTEVGDFRNTGNTSPSSLKPLFQ